MSQITLYLDDATQALVEQATLVMCNVREYSRVQGFHWLNWHQDL